MLNSTERSIVVGDVLRRTFVPGPDSTDPKFDIIGGTALKVKAICNGHINVEVFPFDPKKGPDRLSIPDKYLKGLWLSNEGDEGIHPGMTPIRSRP